MTQIAHQVFVKDPNAVMDFTIDWSNWLGSDTISASSWPEIDSGITKDSDAKTDTQTVIWLSGGTAGEQYYMTNRIVTVGGRTQDRTIAVRVKEL